MSKVVELLRQSDDAKILLPALQTAGNISTGNNFQTEAMINLGLLNVFPKLLRHNKPNIVKVTDEIYGPKTISRLKSDPSLTGKICESCKTCNNCKVIKSALQTKKSEISHTLTL